ncbi:MAG: thiamine pyridinylase [Burkholderiales bacterium]|nr:thiamine pyridinylase [Burkholderiales bacterium]
MTLVAFGALSQLSVTYAQSPATAQSLTVALYPFVPRAAQFQEVLTAEWKKQQPNVKLTFITDFEKWDGGYKKNPPQEADVFVFDATYFEQFRAANLLEPLASNEVANQDDFVEYAKTGVKVGDTFYAIPQLGCANLLFYRKGDTALAAAKTLAEVNRAVGQCTYTSKIPPDKRGLMLDMNGGTTNALLYLDVDHAMMNVYPFGLPQSLNQGTFSYLKTLMAMASLENGKADVQLPYGRALWFSNGWGRALMAYSESMSVMSEETRNNIEFKPMPFSDNGTRPLFYSDVIGVNPTSKNRGTRALAVQLANVMAASSTMIASSGPDSGSQVPQYLMPARHSVFQNLARTFPLYGKMHAMLQQANPRMYKAPDGIRAWTNQMKEPIIKIEQSEYACGCDKEIDTVLTSSNAAAVCSASCADSGGWNGQWTDKFPSAPFGKSACGCKACGVK